MTIMLTRYRIQGGWTIAALAALGLCLDHAALANPLPPVYLEFPAGPGPYVSQVGGPLLADDFTSRTSRRIVAVEWWGSYTEAPWVLTLYPNADGDPTRPDPDGSSIALVEPRRSDPWPDVGVHHYYADVSDPAWRVEKGQSYWLGVASYGPEWTWALGRGRPALGSLQRQAAVVAADGVDWEALAPPTSFAFAVWPFGVPEPGSLVLLGLGLTGIALSQRRLSRRRDPG